MASFYPIISSFISGILSRRMWGRTQSEAYATALEQCKNFEITPQGTAKKRAGSRFIDNIDAITEGANVTLKTFQQSNGNDYVVVFTDEKVFIANKDGRLRKGVNLTTNGSFETGTFAGWAQGGAVPVNPAPSGSGGSGWSLPSIAGEGFVALSYIDADVSQYWNRLRQDNITTAYPAGIHRAYLRAAIGMGEVGNNTITMTLKIGKTLYGTEYVKKSWSVASSTTVKIDESFQFTATGSQIYISIETIRNGSNDMIASSTVYEMSLYANEQIIDEFVEFPNPYDPDELRSLQIAMDSASAKMFIAHPKHLPQVLTHNINSGVWSLAPVVFTTPPTEWKTNNYPACCAIHQARLYFAATPDEGGQVWASKVGVYENFTTGSNPNDSLNFKLEAPVTIRWIESHKVLIMGCDQSDWIMYADSGVITPADYQAAQQSYYGATGIQPTKTGLGLTYVSFNGRKVRSINDGGDSINGWRSEELTLKAPEVAYSPVVELSYTSDPHYQLFALLEDGTISRATFDTNLQILSWVRHTTEGTILSITATNEKSADNLYLAVDRGEPNRIALEYIGSLERTELCLDSFEVVQQKYEGTYTGAFDFGFDSAWDSDGTGITVYADGLTRFANKTVAGMAIVGGLQQAAQQGYFYFDPLVYPQGVIAEGFQTVETGGRNEFFREIPPTPVDANGRCVLPDWIEASDSVYLGLPYTAYLKTVPLEGGNQAGTAQSSKRRWPKVFARLLLSTPPKINGYTPKVYDADKIPPWGTESDAFISDDLDVSSEGFMRNGAIEIESDTTLRCEVVALFGKAGVSEV